MEISDNLTKGLKILRLKYAQNSIMAQISKNSRRNKSGLLVTQIASYIDVLMISETKIDEPFPTSQFLIDSFSSPYRLGRNANRGNILVYFKKDNINKSLKILNSSIKAIFIEMNLRSKIWIICFTHNPNKFLVSSIT